jgi:hypothetical protein
MNPDLERAKSILDTKALYFMQWQVDDAKQRGEDLMGKEDIEFLLSLDSIKQEGIAAFEPGQPYTGVYDSEKLFIAVGEAVKQGKKGIDLCTDLKAEDKKIILGKGYFVFMEAHGSCFWEEVYFSEEAYVQARISHFKNMFGSFASVAPLI